MKFQNLSLKSLKISLSNCDICDEEFVIIMDLFQQTKRIDNLHLNFSHNQIGMDQSVQKGLFDKIDFSINQLKNFYIVGQGPLQKELFYLHLDLSDNYLNEKGAKVIFDNYVSKFENLKYLDVRLQ